LVVYILPYPRYGFLGSSASGNTVFLSPGVCEPTGCFTAFTITHEFGHIFQHVFAPTDESGRWENYLRVRGIYDDPRYTESSQHRNRPREIFAEDFRYLFGGEEACYTHSLENSSLMLPDMVEGLEEFFISLLSPVVASAPDGETPPHDGIVSSANFPNPFNPSTTIEVLFGRPAEAAPHNVELSIYRADGSLVRTLYRGEVGGTVFRAGWDGRDASGAAAPSGVYFYRFRSGAEVATGKMLLVR
ncbi:MAG TPA: FlgD immunoglobulin-like domain containing protein, partial [Patescibacteria group bacterium]|nr:FlgD immunoglobulin-like domain containing protein [Patescibacteria group bacterium]